MEDPMDLLSVVVPCYNEEEVIQETHRQLCSIIPKLNMEMEILFINDGSRDNTMLKLRAIAQRHSNVRVLSFSRNFGHQSAITAGVDHAKGDAVVFIDADLQDPVEVIVEMAEKWRQGFEVVYGTRTERKGESWFKLASANLFYRLIYTLSDQTIPMNTGDFRLIDRKVVNALKNMPERLRYMRGLVAWLGFRSTAVNYVREPRYAGRTKYPIGKMLKLGMDGIVSFSYKPLRLASLLGGLVSSGSFLYLLYLVYERIFTGDLVPGWTSIMVVLLFSSGAILVVLGIMGEYIARIYEEVKGRPIYVLDNSIKAEDAAGTCK